MNSKGIVDLCKVNFYIRKLFIQSNTGGCYAHITGGVGIQLHVPVPILVPVCPVYFSVFMASNQSNSRKPCHPFQIFSKFDALLHNTHSKVLLVLRYQGSTSLGL